MTEKVVNLTAHSMQNNIMVSGLAGDKKGENFKQTALSFLQDKMNLPVNMNDILVAHRVDTSSRKRQTDDNKVNSRLKGKNTGKH